MFLTINMFLFNDLNRVARNLGLGSKRWIFFLK